MRHVSCTMLSVYKTHIDCIRWHSVYQAINQPAPAPSAPRASVTTHTNVVIHIPMSSHQWSTAPYLSAFINHHSHQHHHGCLLLVITSTLLLLLLLLLTVMTVMVHCMLVSLLIVDSKTAMTSISEIWWEWVVWSGLVWRSVETCNAWNVTLARSLNIAMVRWYDAWRRAPLVLISIE